MSRFQTNTLFWSLLIAWLRYYFCIWLLGVDIYVGVLWGITAICIAIWIWWKQAVWWFIGGILSVITSISFVFSAIPVYQYIPELDTFYATQIPRVLCSENINGTLQINKMTIDMRDICTRWGFPILANQEIASSISWEVLVDVAMWNSVIIGNWYKGLVIRTYEKDKPYFTLRIIQEGSPKTINTIQTSSQIRIQNEYKDNLQKYLITNYPRKWSYAPIMTNITLWKMQILALLDWRYNDWIRWLEFYMSHMK